MHIQALRDGIDAQQTFGGLLSALAAAARPREGTPKLGAISVRAVDADQSLQETPPWSALIPKKPALDPDHQRQRLA